ncbi:MAG: histone deacetylase [Acidimicrobiia bacterium]
MEVLVAKHESSFRHDTGSNHPERPERVRAVERGVGGSGLVVTEIESPPITKSQLAVVHDVEYVDMIESLCSLGGGALDMDTVVSAASWDAALTSAGGVWALIQELQGRSDATGFSVARPPGHHALANRAMGFCIFNNVAISAALLRSQGQRVAILDWDVHHGNGTQSMLGNDPGTLYVSLHRDHFYPFEGRVEDIDVGDGIGTTVNIPVPVHTAGDVYRRAWAELVIPVVSQFGPDWILISSGYDAHLMDPLGGLSLVADDYGWLAAQVAAIHPSNRTVVVLEGGYDTDALEQSTAATLLGLAGIANEVISGPTSPPESQMAVDRAWIAIGRHWAL